LSRPLVQQPKITQSKLCVLITFAFCLLLFAFFLSKVMADTLLIRGARELLTLRGPAGPRRGPELSELGLIRDGAILIRDGRIYEVGTSRRIENLAEARDAEEIQAAGRVVMPGFVDSHTHLIWGFPRLRDYQMRISGMQYAQIAAAGRSGGWRGGPRKASRNSRATGPPRSKSSPAMVSMRRGSLSNSASCRS